MSLTLKVILALLILLSLPGVAVTLYASMVAGSLIYAEMFPDPKNIAHGMGMLALVPMIAWALLGLAYLFCLWLLWLVARKVSRSDISIFKRRV